MTPFLATPDGGQMPITLEFSTEMTAVFNASLTSVTTDWRASKMWSVEYLALASVDSAQFSSHIFASPIAVAAGQIIVVKVVISFSA